MASNELLGIYLNDHLAAATFRDLRSRRPTGRALLNTV